MVKPKESIDRPVRIYAISVRSTARLVFVGARAVLSVANVSAVCGSATAIISRLPPTAYDSNYT
jgi:hypothetical protein